MEQSELFDSLMNKRRVRQTQLDAYHKIKAQGLLSKRRFQIYERLFMYGPMTARGTLEGLGLDMNHSGRFTELEDMEAIEEVGKVKSTRTGHTVTLYDVTGRLPVKHGYDTKKQRKEASLREVQAVELLRQIYRDYYNQQAEISRDLLSEIETFFNG